MDDGGDQGFADLLVLGTRGTLEPSAAVRVLRDGERLAGEEVPPFAEELLEPWLNRASREVNGARMRAATAIAGEPVSLDGLLMHLKRRLSELVSPALGEWPGGADARVFWRTFPALHWLVARTVRDWAKGTILFLERLAGDQALLSQSLGLTNLPAITSVEATSSDLHLHGAIVLKVEFAEGGCVFYKPRPVTGEWLWWAVLEAISAGVPLPAARVVFGRHPAGQPAYGWMESVLEQEAWPGRRVSGSSDSRSAYWQRAGVLLCFAQHLRLTDLHMGNVLATPHGPAVTDAECLGTVGVAPSVCDEFTNAIEGLRGTGLLPQNQGRAGVDASGLFGKAAPVPRLKVSCWAVSQTGAWRLTEWPAALARHGNMPHNPAVDAPRAVATELCKGYRLGAEMLMQVRGQLLAEGSAWRRTLETMHAPRAVLRETLFYGSLLSRSLGPPNVGDQTGRQRTLAEWVGENAAVPKRVLEAEVRALMAGSVPRFVISQGSRSLCDSDGRLLQRNFSACTSAEAVVRELELLTTSRLEESLLPALLAALL